jgi:hypothetical protein
MKEPSLGIFVALNILAIVIFLKMGGTSMICLTWIILSIYFSFLIYGSFIKRRKKV